MGMINSVVKNAHDNALSGDSFAPDGNDVDVIANRATGLTIIQLNTNMACLLVEVIINVSKQTASGHHVTEQATILKSNYRYSQSCLSG